MASMLFCQWRRHVGPLGRSKTDQTGEGEVVFITRRAMTTLGELRQLRLDAHSLLEVPGEPIQEGDGDSVAGLDPKHQVEPAGPVHGPAGWN